MTGMVQLSDVEVEADRLLAESGGDLDDVLEPFEPLERDPVFEQLPAAGWRQLREIQFHEMSRIVFAAPHPHDPDGWALINIAHRDGHSSGSALPGPIRPRPGKEARRAGLRLHWEVDPVIGIAGEMLGLRVALTNDGARSWTDGSGETDWPDHLRVVGWICDLAGNQLPAEIGFSWGGFRNPVQIDPGETLVLDVHLLTDAVEALPAGDYELRAMLVSLNLRSEPGRLHLVPQGPTAPSYTSPEPEPPQLPSKYYGVPRTVSRAEHWVNAIVEAIGDAFDPAHSFAAYPPGSDAAAFVGPYAPELDRCLTAARALLGKRLKAVIAAATRKNKHRTASRTRRGTRPSG